MSINCARAARLAAGLAVCLLSIGATEVFAQSSPAQDRRVYVDPVRGQSIDELVALAIRQSPDASAARTRIDLARGDLAQADRLPNPVLSFERRDQLSGTDHQTGVGVVIPLDLFRRSGRVNTAARSVDAATAAAADRDRTIATNVRVLAMRLLAAVHHLEVMDAIAAANRQTVGLIAARVEAGAAPAVERDVARIDTQMSEAEVHRKRVEVENAAALLRSAVGLGPGDPLLLRQSLEDLALAPAASATPITAADIQIAVNARPDLRQADAAIARETARQDSLRQAGKTDVSLVASYMRMVAGFPQLGLTPAGRPTPIQGTFDLVTIGATVTLPFRDSNQGAIAAAGSAIRTAQLERDGLRLAALNEIDALRQREVEARAALRLFSGGLRELAAHNVDVLRESYQLGRATLLEVLTETRRYLDVETAYASALLELAETRVALAGALGETR